MAERCRPETVTVDGREVTVVVRGDRPMDDEDRGHLAELVAATRRHVQRNREFWSPACRSDQHAPACDGYYPPGPDTYRCHCTCHTEVPSGGDPDHG